MEYTLQGIGQITKFSNQDSIGQLYLDTVLNRSRTMADVATPEPGPTRMVSPNRNPGSLSLFLFIFRVIKFSFSKMSRPESPARPESEPGLLRRFHLS